METRKIEFDEDIIVASVVSPCRQGDFIYVICKTKIRFLKLKKMLKDYLSSKRGIFTHKGIVVMSVDNRLNIYSYFDKIILFKDKHGRQGKIEL